MYPCVLIVLVCILMVFLVTYVVPTFATLYSSMQATLPQMTMILIAVGTTAGAAGPYLAGIVYDRYNTYAPAFYWVAGFSFAATILLLFATPPVRRAAPLLAPVAVNDVD